MSSSHRAVRAALTPGEVGGEIFGMNLQPRREGGEVGQGQPPLPEDHDGLVAVGGERPASMRLPATT